MSILENTIEYYSFPIPRWVEITVTNTIELFCYVMAENKIPHKWNCPLLREFSLFRVPVFILLMFIFISTLFYTEKYFAVDTSTISIEHFEQFHNSYHKIVAYSIKTYSLYPCDILVTINFNEAKFSGFEVF